MSKHQPSSFDTRQQEFQIEYFENNLDSDSGFSVSDDEFSNIATNTISRGSYQKKNLFNEQQSQQSHQLNEDSIPNIQRRHNQASRDLTNIISQTNYQQQDYSLLPDMANGWKPRFSQQNIRPPVPLYYLDRNLGYIIQKLSILKNYPIVYLAPHYKDTYELHQKYSGPDTYPYNLGSVSICQDILTRCNMTLDQELNWFREGYTDSDDYLNYRVFSGFNHFECGNIDCIVQIAENQYDLYMRVDANTRGHLQWFYFQIKNAKPQSRVIINICNFTQKRSLYERGMKPYIYSNQKKELQNIEWYQGGENVKYSQRITLKYQAPRGRQQYFKLRFQYQFEYDNDEISFAASPPYSFSCLRQKLILLDSNQQIDDGNNNKYLQLSSLCQSLSGLTVPLVTITDFQNLDIPILDRQLVVICARIHPGETSGSWVMDGLIDYLCGEGDVIANIRKKMIFKLVPMLNPDGVVVGNYRSDLAGQDLNRQYGETSENLYPTVYSFQKLISDLQSQWKDNFLTFFDFHGHSNRKNIFIYGPAFPQYDLRYYKARIIAKLLSKQTEMFRFHSCQYQNDRNKRFTGRVCIQQDYRVIHSYTFEASLGSFINQNRDSFAFTTEKWREFGSLVIAVTYEFMEMLETYEQIKESQIPNQKKEKKFSLTQNNVSPNNVNNESKRKNLNELKDATPDINKQNSQSSADIMEEASEPMELFNLKGIISDIANDQKNFAQKNDNESDQYSSDDDDHEEEDEDLEQQAKLKFHLNLNNQIEQIKAYGMNQKNKRDARNNYSVPIPRQPKKKTQQKKLLDDSTRNRSFEEDDKYQIPTESGNQSSKKKQNPILIYEKNSYNNINLKVEQDSTELFLLKRDSDHQSRAPYLDKSCDRNSVLYNLTIQNQKNDIFGKMPIIKKQLPMRSPLQMQIICDKSQIQKYTSQNKMEKRIDPDLDNSIFQYRFNQNKSQQQITSLNSESSINDDLAQSNNLIQQEYSTWKEHMKMTRDNPHIFNLYDRVGPQKNRAQSLVSKNEIQQLKTSKDFSNFTNINLPNIQEFQRNQHLYNALMSERIKIQNTGGYLSEKPSISVHPGLYKHLFCDEPVGSSDSLTNFNNNNISLSNKIQEEKLKDVIDNNVVYQSRQFKSYVPIFSHQISPSNKFTLNPLSNFQSQ